jgi:hypothetical protein
MNATVDDELESALRELFARQAHATPVITPPWDAASLAQAWPSRRRRTRRHVIAWGVAAMLTVTATVAIVATQIHTEARHVVVGSTANAGLPWSTHTVSLTATDFALDIYGKHFTAADQWVDLIFESAGSRSTVLVASWREHDIPLHLAFSFASDGKDWWTDAITLQAEQQDLPLPQTTLFRRPLGTPFDGNVDLPISGPPPTTVPQRAATVPVHGTVHFTDLHLEPFHYAACDHAPGRYIFDTYGDIAVRNHTVNVKPLNISLNAPVESRSFTATPTLLDTTTCVPVSDFHNLQFDWRSVDTSIVTVRYAPSCYGLGTSFPPPMLAACAAHAAAVITPTGRGQTTITITLRQHPSTKIEATTNLSMNVQPCTDKDPPRPGPWCTTTTT